MGENPLKIAGYRRKNKFEKNLKKVLQCAEKVFCVGIIASCDSYGNPLFLITNKKEYYE